MNALQYALNDVRRRIPGHLLEMAFKPVLATAPRINWGGGGDTIQSLDAIIHAKVIEPIVNVDCNLIGAEEVTIQFKSGVSVEMVDQVTRVLRIPYSLTEGRRVVTANSINYLRYAQIAEQGMIQGSSNPLVGAARDLYYSMAPMPIVGSANLEIIGDNVILARDWIQVTDGALSVTVTLENAEDMSNLKRGAWKYYAKLVELAVKAYIYNTLSDTLDRGRIHAGMDLGKIRETLDGYADAQQQYDEYYDEFWRKVAFTNDRERMYNFVTGYFGRGK